MITDHNIKAIIFVMILIAICLAPDIRNIILICSLCLNAIGLTRTMVSLHKKDESITEDFKAQLDNLAESNFDELLYDEIPKKPEDIRNDYYEHNFEAFKNNKFDDYEGNVDKNNNMQIYDGNDRLAKIGLTHQGDKLARQLAGASKMKENMNNYLYNDVNSDEFKHWWGAYDK